MSANACDFCGEETALEASTRRLEKGQTLALQLGHEFVRVTARSGLCWITMEGDPTDYAVTTQHPLTFAGPGLLVIEGIESENEIAMV